MTPRRTYKQLKSLIVSNVHIVKRSLETPCWEWKKGRHKFGYGQIHYGGRCENIHRVSWVIWKGPIPKGLSVLHRCDNPPCCNPDHLWLGTQAQNVMDAFIKRRNSAARGEASAKAKLTESSVRTIRAWKRQGRFSTKTLSKMFNVTTRQILSIANRESWKHIL